MDELNFTVREQVYSAEWIRASERAAQLARPAREALEASLSDPPPAGPAPLLSSTFRISGVSADVPEYSPHGEDRSASFIGAEPSGAAALYCNLGARPKTGLRGRTQHGSDLEISPVQTTAVATGRPRSLTLSNVHTFSHNRLGAAGGAPTKASRVLFKEPATQPVSKPGGGVNVATRKSQVCDLVYLLNLIYPKAILIVGQ